MHCTCSLHMTQRSCIPEFHWATCSAPLSGVLKGSVLPLPYFWYQAPTALSAHIPGCMPACMQGYCSVQRAHCAQGSGAASLMATGQGREAETEGRGIRASGNGRSNWSRHSEGGGNEAEQQQQQQQPLEYNPEVCRVRCCADECERVQACTHACECVCVCMLRQKAFPGARSDNAGPRWRSSAPKCGCPSSKA